MGLINHSAVLATTYDEKRFGELVSWISACDDKGFFVVDSEPKMNGYRTAICVPDGSKEGWKGSDEGESRRSQFIAVLESIGSFDWVEVGYGELGSTIERTNCQ